MFHVAGLDPGSGTLTGNCGDNPGIACRLTWDITHNTNAAQLVRVYLAGPVTQGLRILFVILIALVVRAVANRVINRLTERAATSRLPVAAAAIRPAIRRRRAPPRHRRPTRRPYRPPRWRRRALSGTSSGPGRSARSCAAGCR